MMQRLNVVIALFWFLFLSQAHAFVEPSSNAKGKSNPITVANPLSQTKTFSPQFNPKRMIVKYKNDLGSRASILFDSNKPFSTVTRSSRLDDFHQKRGVKKIKRLFQKLEQEGKRQKRAFITTAELTSKFNKKFPKRARRAPKNPKVPTLENVYAIEFGNNRPDILALVEEYKKDPNVEYAQPDYVMRANYVPNDPYYTNTGSWGQTYDDLWALKATKLNMGPAWDLTKGSGVIVAVVDSGIDYDHDDISANVWANLLEVPDNGIDDDNNGFIDDTRGWDFAENDNDPWDGHGHGTHVSGTIAAVGNNNKGIIGVAPEAKIMPLKGLSDTGSGYTEDLALAILYAADNGADVMNNSWGCGSDCPSNPVIEDALRMAYAAGVITIFAAGNTNTDVMSLSPQNMDEVITVSATDPYDQKSSFSNFGMFVDVAAPGGDPSTGLPPYEPRRNILSLKAAGASSLMTGSGQLVVGTNYLRQAGTSMAAPHVSGLMALILSKNPTFSFEQAHQALLKGAQDLGPVGFDTTYGYGRINAYQSLLISNPPEVNISDPSFAPTTTFENVQVKGSMNGQGITSAKLYYYAEGALPSTKVLIGNVPTSVQNGLLYSWNARSLNDGRYVLLLEATTASGVYSDHQLITIDNISLKEPSTQNLNAYRSGTIITIKGSAVPYDFLRYDIKILINQSPLVELPQAQITLTNNGLSPVNNDILGQWDTTGVAANHYRIQLTVTHQDQRTTVEYVKVMVDPILREGWPIFIGKTGWTITDHLNMADVNRDGRKELLIGYGDTVRLYDHEGHLLPGWPQPINTLHGTAFLQKSPAAGNLLGDESLEIVASNNSGDMYVWNAQGELLPGWPKEMGTINSLVIDDINGDGTNEIIFSNWGGSVIVVDVNGNPMWSKNLFFGICHPPSIGDVDGDSSTKEIVVMQSEGPSNLYVISHEGNLLPGWPKTISPGAPSNIGASSIAALADLDNDGDLEIIVGSQDGKVYAFHHDGSNVSGWPQLTFNDQNMHSPAVGDINGDGVPEIVIGTDERLGSNQTRMYAFNRNGSVLSGWPVMFSGYRWRDFFGIGAPALADVNNDNQADIIFASDGYSANPMLLHAYNTDGTIIPGFPRPVDSTGSDVNSTVAIDDMDGDGKVEMAWISFEGYLYLWDLPTTLDKPRPWPMFQHDAAHTGNIAPFTLRDKFPPTGTITINNGDQNTSIYDVTLNLSASDSTSGMGPGAQMQFSNNSTTNKVTWSVPEPYATTKLWKISGLGTRTVCVKFKDVAGNWSIPYCDSIRYVGNLVGPAQSLNTILTAQNRVDLATLYGISVGDQLMTNMNYLTVLYNIVSTPPYRQADFLVNLSKAATLYRSLTGTLKADFESLFARTVPPAFTFPETSEQALMRQLFVDLSNESTFDITKLSLASALVNRFRNSEAVDSRLKVMYGYSVRNANLSSAVKVRQLIFSIVSEAGYNQIQFLNKISIATSLLIVLRGDQTIIDQFKLIYGLSIPPDGSLGTTYQDSTMLYQFSGGASPGPSVLVNKCVLDSLQNPSYCLSFNIWDGSPEDLHVYDGATLRLPVGLTFNSLIIGPQATVTMSATPPATEEELAFFSSNLAPLTPLRLKLFEIVSMPGYNLNDFLQSLFPPAQAITKNSTKPIGTKELLPRTKVLEKRLLF